MQQTNYNWSFQPFVFSIIYVNDLLLHCFSLFQNLHNTKIPLKYVPWGLIDNMALLVQIMAWRRPGDKPLSEPMLNQYTDAYMQHFGEMS